MKPGELREQVEFDLHSCAQTLGYIDDLRDQMKSREQPTVHDLAALGTYVHNIYLGIENILKRFAKFHGVALPDGANWHENLLRMFSEPSVAPLPALIPRALDAEFVAYRGFRHVFNKRYAVELDWDKLKPLVEGIRRTFDAFHLIVEQQLARIERN